MIDPPCKSALVTGAAGGIGSAVARRLASKGLKLLLTARKGPGAFAAHELAKEIGCEVRDWDVLLSPDAGLIAAVGRLDGPLALVHCAGVLGPAGVRFGADYPPAWARAVEVNLMGAVRAVRLVLPRMTADAAGRVVLFGGGGSCEARPGFSAYSVSKTAVLRLAECIAEEYAGHGIRCFAAAPGAVETRMLQECRAAGDPPSRVLDVSECCGLVERLLTEDAAALSGRLVHVRDRWPPDAETVPYDHWKLRRVK